MGDSHELFDWSSIAPGDEHYRLASEEYRAGRSFPEIVALLEQRGLPPELVPDVTTALAKDRAFHLFSAGKKPAEVRATLVERGLSPGDAEYIARAVEGSSRAAAVGEKNAGGDGVPGADDLRETVAAAESDAGGDRGAGQRCSAAYGGGTDLLLVRDDRAVPVTAATAEPPEHAASLQGRKSHSKTRTGL